MFITDIPAKAGIYSKGFTLIEILVVVLIISIVTSVGVLTISRNNDKEMELFAKEMVQVIRMAEEQAMLQPAELGLIINEQYYQFVIANIDEKSKQSQWSPLDDKVLGEHPIPAHAVITIANVDIEKIKQPAIVISTNGDITPFTLYIGKAGAKPRFAITGEADGTIVFKEMD